MKISFRAKERGSKEEEKAIASLACSSELFSGQLKKSAGNHERYQLSKDIGIPQCPNDA